jgi:hypothetical protein
MRTSGVSSENSCLGGRHWADYLRYDLYVEWKLMPITARHRVTCDTCGQRENYVKVDTAEDLRRMNAGEEPRRYSGSCVQCGEEVILSLGPLWYRLCDEHGTPRGKAHQFGAFICDDTRIGWEWPLTTCGLSGICIRYDLYADAQSAVDANPDHWFHRAGLHYRPVVGYDQRPPDDECCRACLTRRDSAFFGTTCRPPIDRLP